VLNKQVPVKLDGEEYERFRRSVFDRDGWKCRNPFCRSNVGLSVHHIVKRSKIRLDTMENCIALCVACHEAVERGVFVIEDIDNGRYKFFDKGTT